MTENNLKKQTSTSLVTLHVAVNFSITMLLTLFIMSLTFSAAYAQESSDSAADREINKKIERIKEINRESGGGIISDESMDSGEDGDESVYLSNVIIRIFFYLILIILLILAFVWLMKYLGDLRSRKGEGSSIDLIDVLNLGQNRSVFLVRVMESVYILAQTQQKVTLIDKIEGEKALELIASGEGGTSIMQFKDMFNNFLGKFKRDEETGG